jgi:hypothetical protein
VINIFYERIVPTPNIIYTSKKRLMTLENNSYHVYDLKENNEQTLVLATPNLKKAEEFFFENESELKKTEVTRSNKLQKLFLKYKL